MNFSLDPEVWEALKLEGVRQGLRSIQSTMEELVNDYLAAQQRERGAKKQ